jgi:predicted phosphodiesterase
MSVEPDAVTFVVPGDLHLTEPGLENHRVAQWMIQEVNDVIEPDFVQFIGDNVQDATDDQFALFNALRARLTVPDYVLVGDHDVKNDPEALAFRAHVGPTHGAISRQGVRFIRLDTQEARPVGLSRDQLQWFQLEVETALAAGERIVIFQHNYPYQIWEDFDGPGIDDWRSIVQANRITAIVCGHTHYAQAANDGRNVMVATRSIGDPEGGPPGYMIGYLRGEDLAFAYRSVEDQGPIVLITHPRETLLATGRRHIVVGRDQIRVRTWSASPISAVRGCLDGDCWFSLELADASFWEAPLPGDRLAKGEHALEVQAFDQEGRRGSQRLGFMVDHTGRFTAVPSVHPRVTQTAFC